MFEQIFRGKSVVCMIMDRLIVDAAQGLVSVLACLPLPSITLAMYKADGHIETSLNTTLNKVRSWKCMHVLPSGRIGKGYHRLWSDVVLSSSCCGGQTAEVMVTECSIHRQIAGNTIRKHGGITGDNVGIDTGKHSEHTTWLLSEQPTRHTTSQIPLKRQKWYLLQLQMIPVSCKSRVSHAVWVVSHNL